MDDDKFDINIDELRNIDLGALLNVDLDNAVRPLLRLEDLENVDWENVASYVLGITDPIGQLRDFLASLLSGFVDTIKNLFVSIVSPISDAINKILGLVSYIPDVLTNLANTINSVVLDPIRDVIQFAIDALGNLKDMFTNLVSYVTQTIQSIPNYISNIVSQVANVFNGVIDNIKNVISNIANAIANLPNAISDVLSRIGNMVGDVVGKIQGVFSDLANRIAQIPSAVSDVLSKIGSFVSDLSGKIQSVIGDIVQKIAQIPSAISDALSKIGSFIGDIANRIQSVFSDIVNRVQQGFGTVFNLLQQAGSVIGDFLNRARDSITNVINSIVQNIQNIPNVIRQLVDQVTNMFNNIINTVRSGFEWIVNQIKQLPDLLRNAVSTFTDWLNKALEGIRGGVSWLLDQIQHLPDLFNNIIKQLIGTAETAGGVVMNAFKQIGDWIQNATTLLHQVAGALMGFVNTLQRLPEELWNLLPNEIKGAFQAIVDFFTKTIPGFIKSLQDWWNEFSKDPTKWITDNVLKPAYDMLTKLLSDLWNILPNEIKGVLQGIYDFFTKTVPDTITNFIKSVQAWWNDFSKDPLGWIQRNVIQPLYDKLNEFARTVWNVLPNEIKAFIDGVRKFFTETIPNFIKSVEDWWSDFSKDPPKWIKEHIIVPFIEKVKEVLTSIGKAIWDALPDEVKRVVNFFTQTLPKSFESIINQINEFAKDPAKWIQQHVFEPLANSMRKLWDMLPEGVRNALKTVSDFFTKTLPKVGKQLYDAFTEFWKDPWKWLNEHIFKPFLDAAGKIGETITQGFQVIMDVLGKAISSVTSAVRSFIDTIINAVLDVVKPHSPALLAAFLPVVFGVVMSMTPAFDAISKDIEDDLTGRWVKGAEKVEEILQKGFEQAKGIGHQMWWIGSQLMMPYWQSTVVAFALRGLAKALGDMKIKFEPEIAGTKIIGFDFTINVGELLTSVAETLPSYAHAFAMGSSFAVAQLYLQNIQSWYVPRVIEYYETVKDKLFKPVAEKFGVQNALYNAFVRLPGAHEAMEWARRWIAVIRAKKYHDEDPEEIGDVAISVPQDVVPKDIQTILDTIKLNMIYTGLPKWFVEFNAQDPDKFYIVFVDRFGKERKIPLSPLYELPTHAELAKMTQREIFPSIKAMQAVTWIRGWNEDISTLMYLLTFKYPPFEKLWQFYMRATSGMLWFSPPDLLRAIIDSEAEQVGAWKPISPLELQTALGNLGADAMKTFETAVTTYLKWLEYSHFSWFTPKTEIQGVKIGQEIINKLGGWTADAWLMWDVSADIPGKIDMRWMSRYGIFQYMAQRLGDDMFSTYKPMVSVITNLMDLFPSSKLTVELHWFSKMLQSTGLHPAWVPIVTVAENIMAISGEMTLLRSGWINMFRSGLLTLDVMDKALSGLFVVSYRVGYWDPDTKTWNSRWINLPIRWLPHAARLIEYRAVIDRIMGLYREYYGYLRSAVRSLMLTPDEARDMLVDFVQVLDAHYSKIVYEMTGQDMHLQQDDAYIKLWFNAFAQLGKFEAMKRARMWWNRISGWLLYRIAQGYVDPNSVMQMLQKLKDLLKLTDIEMDAYTTIVKSIYDIISKERIPTPWQMATLSEYMSVPDDLIVKSINAYNIDDQYRDFLYRYVKLRPIKSDYRELIMDAVRALRSGKISMDVFDQILDRAREFGFTDTEIQILKMRGEFLAMLNEDIESKSVRVPTPWQLATLAEYMAIPQSLVTKSIVEYGLDRDFAEFVARYIAVRPLKADYREVITSAIRALRYGAISQDVFNNILKNALNYGFTEPEIALIQMRTELDLAVDEAREYVPTPAMLATMAEYLPEVRYYIKEVFKARRISGVWAELWTKYIYLRPLVDDVRRWLNAMTTLVEHGILPMDALGDVFKVLSTYGYEQLEQEIITRTVLSNKARYAWNELLGTARNLATMARYSDVAADMAWTRVAKIIDALPVDNATKDAIKTMWKQYITHYQNYPEIRSYVTELVTSYAYGIIDDQTFEKELQYLKQLGVPDMTIALIRRRAQLRRLRVAASRQQSY